LRWLVAMLHGDGLFVLSRQRRPVDPAARPDHPVCVGSSQILALATRSRGVFAAMRPYSIFDQIANTLAFVVFRCAFFTGLLLT